MMTKLSLFEEFAIRSIDELGDEKFRMAKAMRRFAFLKKASSVEM